MPSASPAPKRTRRAGLPKFNGGHATQAEESSAYREWLEEFISFLWAKNLREDTQKLALLRHAIASEFGSPAATWFFSRERGGEFTGKTFAEVKGMLDSRFNNVPSAGLDDQREEDDAIIGDDEQGPTSDAPGDAIVGDDGRGPTHGTPGEAARRFNASTSGDKGRHF